jgi:glycosyltransferase involved in cell wall biosynthesis
MARKRSNALTDCHRGNTHIEYQSRLLASESEYYGVPVKRIDQRLIDKELQEYAEADMITVSSTFAYQSFVEQGVPAEKIVINPEGVNLLRFQPVMKEDSIFRVLYVGQLSLRKGLPYLLEAFAELRLPRFELVLIGGITDHVVGAILSKYEGGFRYLGPVANAKLAYHYSQASIFVLPSIEDGFGLVLAEAMACGLPIVATTNTGAADLITDGVEGFIVPIRDPISLREKVLQLYEDPVLREEMSVAALRRAQGLGGWKSYADRALLAYRERLADRR